MHSEYRFSSTPGSAMCDCGTEPLRLERAQTIKTRLTGLLGKRSMSSGEAIWLDPCRAVHTWGMRFDLAIYFLDRSLNVIEWHPRVAPGQVRICLKAFSVVETIAIASGHCYQTHLDRLQLALRQRSEGSEYP